MLTLFDSHPALSIIIGTVFIGLGGYIATGGWSAQSSAETKLALRQAEERRVFEQRRAMLSLLESENVGNLSLLKSTYNESDPKELEKFVLFLPLIGDALAAATASGLFSYPDDARLHRTIFELQGGITIFNYITQTAQIDLFRVADNRDASKKKEQTSKVRKLVQNSSQLGFVRRRIGTLSIVLAEKIVELEGLDIPA